VRNKQRHTWLFNECLCGARYRVVSGPKGGAKWLFAAPGSDEFKPLTSRLVPPCMPPCERKIENHE
jgi:hypothetical protein